MQTEPLAQLLEVLSFAAHAHAHNADQNAPGIPYINHPIAVAHALASEAGIADITVLSAALLHDVMEKAGVTRQQIKARFGAAVAALVDELTDDPALGERERKRQQARHAPALSPGAKAIKLADKLCNLRDVVAARRRVQPSPHDTAAHFDWCAQVVAGLRGCNPALEAAFDAVMRHRPA